MSSPPLLADGVVVVVGIVVITYSKYFCPCCFPLLSEPLVVVGGGALFCKYRVRFVRYFSRFYR